MRPSPIKTQPGFRVWKTIKLGTRRIPEEYRNGLREAGFQIGSWVDDMLRQTPCAQVETEQDLVILSVKELGFVRSADYKNVCAKAAQMGLELCPAEIGPALRLSYKDQPPTEWLRIAMKAITSSSHGESIIFAVRNDFHGLWLLANLGRPEDPFDFDSLFVFSRPRL